MAAILSSPQLAPAAWSMEEPHLLSSPVARDGCLPHELDHSFGSSMSISSLDSPGHCPSRPRAVTTTLDVLHEDPFSAPSPATSEPMQAPWGVRSRADLVYGQKSSPHAMEISSPAAFPPPMPAPRPCVRPIMPRRADRTMRRSMPLLPSVAELQQGSPQREPPMKKRLSSLRQLQDASFERDDDALSDRIASDRHAEDSGIFSQPAIVRTHARSQSPQQTNAPSPMPAAGPPQMDPSPVPVVRTEPADDSWSFSGPESGKRPCLAWSGKAAASPRGMGDYFFHPESPQVGMADGMCSGGLLQPPSFSPSSSPSSSPCLRSSALPQGLFSSERQGGNGLPVSRDGACVRVSTVHNIQLVQTVESPLDDSDESLMMPEPPHAHRGSPVRASLRKNRLVGMTARRTQTTAMLPPPVDKENEAPAPCISVSPGLPGFGTFEIDRKILPCFPVKSDGLMRITPHTIRELLQGKYDERIHGFQIVDCRFAYEHEGGHIAGAINLNTVEQVQQHFLTPGQGFHQTRNMPVRTQSGMPDEHGDARKFVLIFHCEFSWKRAPSMALALRAADRSLASDYPKCHFPDVYVLQGGYADFFKSCPDLCEPQAYVPMDDPRYNRRRSEELTGYRKQFVRNRSFAYGDEHFSALAMLSSRLNTGAERGAPPPAPSQLAPPQDARETSFSSAGDSSFEADASFSPCAAATFRRPAPPADEPIGGTAPPTLMRAFARRPLIRAETMPSTHPMCP